MSLGDPIDILLSFDSLHADDEGNVTIKFKLPPSECGKAGLFPLLRRVVFRGVFTPDQIENQEPTL